MFDRIKRALSRHAWPGEVPDSMDGVSRLSYAPMSEWAASQGFELGTERARQSFSVTGRVAGSPWRLELGPPSRSYIQGEELRARADLGLDPRYAVLLMSRQLKDSLQAQSDRLPIHNPQALPEPRLTEELRWLAQYPEVDWIGPSLQFWGSYAVMTPQREHAIDWLDPHLVRQLLAWPLPVAETEVPFLLLVLNGRVYLRMEYRPCNLPTLQHAAGIFTNACESAAALMRPPPGDLPAASDTGVAAAPPGRRGRIAH